MDRQIETQETSNYISPDHQLHESDDAAAPKRKRYWPWILLLLLLCAIGYWACSHRGQSSNAQPPGGGGGGRRALTGPVAITTANAKKGDIGVYLDAIGTVTALYTVSITAQVTGVITAVHYREGQVVHKGDPLIDIDPRPFAALVTQAEGVLFRDQHVLAQAQMDLERYQAAWAQNAIQRQTLEDQQKVVLQQQGTVKTDEGSLRYNQVQLAYCHITSPINGRVGLRLVDAGNLVTANSTTSLVVITETQPITVVATLSEDNLSQVLQQPGHGLHLSLEAWDRSNSKKIATGRVTSYDNQIDTTTGTVKFRAIFENKQGELYANEFVNTRLLVKTLHEQILLPSSAIQHNGATAFVYVIQNSQAVLRRIKTGVSYADETAVQGVNENEVVANSGFERLQNGVKVTIAQAKPASSSDGGDDEP
jgi:membrane fusion protein, multidrug efflux system